MKSVIGMISEKGTFLIFLLIAFHYSRKGLYSLHSFFILDLRIMHRLHMHFIYLSTSVDLFGILFKENRLQNGLQYSQVLKSRLRNVGI